jgi:hypothetical protein
MKDLDQLGAFALVAHVSRLRICDVWSQQSAVYSRRGTPRPSRPSRARPTPADLLQASDATGIPFVELLEALWGIEPARLADELALLGLGGSAPTCGGMLSDAESAEVSDFVDFLVSRQRKSPRSRSLSRLTSGPR